MAWKGRGVLLTLGLLYVTVSLQVGLCSAATGSCTNVLCGSGYCCSHADYCGVGDSYCGVGCKSGSCYGNSSGSLGSCLNQSCPDDAYCCSEYHFCGKNSSYCGIGCLSGPCYSNSGGTSQMSSGAAIAGFALASVLGSMTLLGTLLSSTPRRVGISWRSRMWLLTFALVCITNSLRVGLSRADAGSCINQICGTGASQLL